MKTLIWSLTALIAAAWTGLVGRFAGHTKLQGATA